MRDVKFLRIDKKTKQLVFESPNGNVVLSQLSDGYQNIAAWIGDLLYRISNTFDDYKNPLTTRGLLLIDEIDLHLHPKWQRILLDFIQRKLPKFQVICTTHSPLTAQQADENELFYLERERAKVVLKPFVGSPKKLGINQLLTSPIFGLDSDDSYEIERLKKSQRELNNSIKKLTEIRKKKVEKD